MNKLFDRNSLEFHPLAERKNKLEIGRNGTGPADAGPPLSAQARPLLEKAAAELRLARQKGRPVILAFGAHAIKNGLSPVLADLLRAGWISHFATNGAGIIHDWEFAYQGKSGEDVRLYAAQGRFGIWRETGFYLNLALLIGAWRGFGYGESVGALVEEEGLTIPTQEDLSRAIAAAVDQRAGQAALERAGAAVDLLAACRKFDLASGFLELAHPCKKWGLQAAAFRAGLPFTAHPMFGHDIIYAHPLNSGAAVGRTAERDFLSFVDSVSGLQGGVYLSVGSAVMSPMIFEKALSMARNVAHQHGRKIDDFSIYVVDLAASDWNWQKDGEPPADNPAYYTRFLKTFSRMGGRMTYVRADNRAFLGGLSVLLRQ